MGLERRENLEEMFVGQRTHKMVRRLLADLLHKVPDRTMLAQNDIDAADVPVAGEYDPDEIFMSLRLAKRQMVSDGRPRFIVNLARVLDVNKRKASVPFVQVRETAAFEPDASRSRYRRQVQVVDEHGEGIVTDARNVPRLEIFTNDERKLFDEDAHSDLALRGAVEFYDRGIPVEFAADLVSVVHYCLHLQEPRPGEEES